MTYSVVWTKTILHSQRYIKSVCRQLDRVVEKRANVIPGITEGYCGFIDAMEQTKKVLSLVEQKKRTLNLAVCYEKIIELLNPQYKKALFLKFRTSKNSKEIEKLMNCSQRTYFRYVEEALKIFTACRKLINLSDEELEKSYQQDIWLLKIKENVLEEESAKKRSRRTRIKIETIKNPQEVAV